jgi:hypothetical protein
MTTHCVVCGHADSTVEPTDPPRVFIDLLPLDRARSAVCSVCVDALADVLANARALSLDLRDDGTPLLGAYRAVEAEIAFADQAERRRFDRPHGGAP